MNHRPLRVLAVVPSGFCFGLQNVTLAFFSELPENVDAHFLNTRWNDGEFPRRLTELGISHSATWLGMFSRRLDWRNLRMTLECVLRLPVAYADCARLIRRLRPDVIFVANHHEVILLWPLLLMFRRKVVCHMHDPPPPIPFQKASFCVWRRAIGRFIFISQDVRHRLALLGPLSDRDVVLHNGIAVADLSLPRQRSDRFRRQFGWPDTALIVGLTGQMSPHKGHEDFLAAIRLLAQKEPSLRFVIGGKQQEPFASSLKRMCTEYGIEDIVGFAGWSPTSRDFFEAIDVFVMASRHDEGFGLVVAEAGERGLPVVCTRSGGAVEIVVDSHTGLLVGKCSPEEMAAAVAQLAQNATLRAEMGEAARRRVCQHFNLSNQADRLALLLAEEANCAAHH